MMISISSTKDTKKTDRIMIMNMMCNPFIHF